MRGQPPCGIHGKREEEQKDVTPRLPRYVSPAPTGSPTGILMSSCEWGHFRKLTAGFNEVLVDTKRRRSGANVGPSRLAESLCGPSTLYTYLGTSYLPSVGRNASASRRCTIPSGEELFKHPSHRNHATAFLHNTTACIIQR